MSLADRLRPFVPRGMRAWVRRSLIARVPLARRLGRDYWQWRSFLAEAQWWDRERVEAWQLGRLRRVVAHAYEHVPGYRALYREAGVKPEDIGSLRDLRGLPCVSKELLRDNLADFTARDVPRRRLRYVTTGGSTGIPFGFFHTSANAAMEQAFIHLGWERAGWRLGELSAVLRGVFVGSERDYYLFDPAGCQLHLSTYYLSERTVDKYLLTLARFGPAHLQAYPSAATMLADLVLARGDVGRLALRTVLLGSENIYDWQIERIRQAFPGVRIFGWYGHAEQAVLAPWCEQTSRYHVWPFYGLVELEAAAAAPERGADEIVATAFQCRATPFIRYRTMDFAAGEAWGCGDCGRQGQVLGEIQGRLQEVLVTGGGRYISMAAINMHSSVFDHVKQFQFRQEAPGRACLRIVPKPTCGGGDLARIHREVMAKLGPDMTLHIETVDEIRPTAAGKFRILDQRLKIGTGDGADEGPASERRP